MDLNRYFEITSEAANRVFNSVSACVRGHVRSYVHAGVLYLEVERENFKFNYNDNRFLIRIGSGSKGEIEDYTEEFLHEFLEKYNTATRMYFFKK